MGFLFSGTHCIAQAILKLHTGGGANLAPPEILAVDHAIAAKICTMVVCDVIYKIVYLDCPK